MRTFRFIRHNGRTTPVTRAVAVLALLSIAVLVWLSADPEAHEWFHHSAGETDHHCVVTEFSVGEAYFLSPCIVVRPASTSYVRIDSGEIESPRERVAYLLLPICGPPVAA